MTTIAITQRRPDKATELPPGPWQDEPDKAQWYDETTGMACLIVRNRSGSLCGYVGVEPSHPWHGIAYHGCTRGPCGDEWCEHSPDVLTRVHGGLTYSAPCMEGEGDPVGMICHMPAPGRPADVWWFGFDCAHAGDRSPGLDKTLAEVGVAGGGGTYRDLDYVRSEVESLARQLAAVGVTPEDM